MARNMRNVDYVSVRGMTDEAIDEALDLRDYRKTAVGFQNADGSWTTIADSAMVISPDGKAVSRIVGADYQIHQPRRLRQLFQEFAAESGLELSDIWKSRAALQARYTLPNQLTEITVGDTVSSGLTISTGFDGLSATWLQSWLERLICSNGMRAFSDTAAFQIRHTARLSDDVMRQAASAVDRILASTGAHTSWIRRLTEVDVAPQYARAFFRLIAAPGTTIREAGKITGELTYSKVKPMLDDMARSEQRAITFSNEDDGPLPYNSTARGIGANYAAPNIGSAPGTLAGLYHAVTRYESHDANGGRAQRTWSAMNDRGSQRIALASTILDGWAKGE